MDNCFYSGGSYGTTSRRVILFRAWISLMISREPHVFFLHALSQWPINGRHAGSRNGTLSNALWSAREAKSLMFVRGIDLVACHWGTPWSWVLKARETKERQAQPTVLKTVDQGSTALMWSSKKWMDERWITKVWWGHLHVTHGVPRGCLSLERHGMWVLDEWDPYLSLILVGGWCTTWGMPCGSVSS